MPTVTSTIYMFTTADPLEAARLFYVRVRLLNPQSLQRRCRRRGPRPAQDPTADRAPLPRSARRLLLLQVRAIRDKAGLRAPAAPECLRTASPTRSAPPSRRRCR